MTRSQTIFLSLLLIILSAPLLFTGCATIGTGVEKPTITVTDLSVQEVKALEAIFTLELRVMNPNDYPLDIRGITCDLTLDGNHFANGISDVQQEVPAFGTATVPVTVYASVLDMVGSVIHMLQQADTSKGSVKPLRYELAGKIRLGGSGAVNTLPFDSKGELSFGGANGS
ncbi:MAG: LEA type 2 family protein [Thermodesulfobacteriota bacterium]|nr:LEA type 2 family protein [Thermodesulfobacteriota bacterium]